MGSKRIYKGINGVPKTFVNLTVRNNNLLYLLSVHFLRQPELNGSIRIYERNQTVTHNPLCIKKVVDFYLKFNLIDKVTD